MAEKNEFLFEFPFDSSVLRQMTKLRLSPTNFDPEARKAYEQKQIKLFNRRLKQLEKQSKTNESPQTPKSTSQRETIWLAPPGNADSRRITASLSAPPSPRHSKDYTEICPEESDKWRGGAMNDNDLSQLERELIGDGFTKAEVSNVMKYVNDGKEEVEFDRNRIKEARERLTKRLKLYSLKEVEIPGDGNCLFSAVSDQVYDTISEAGTIRRNAVSWLRQHGHEKLPNGACLKDFVCDQEWDEYLMNMSTPGIWGDHVMLVAITEIFGVNACVISSIECDDYIQCIYPTFQKSRNSILLCHYAEYHYGSLRRS